MTIAAILKTKGDEVETLEIGASVAQAVALMTRRRIGAVPVMDGGAVAGMFSERDVIHGLDDGGAATLDMPVGRLMTAPAVTVGRDETAIGALALMTRRRIRHLPVVEDGRLVGLVSIGDLVKHRIDGIEADAAALRAYIQSA